MLFIYYENAMAIIIARTIEGIYGSVCTPVYCHKSFFSKQQISLKSSMIYLICRSKVSTQTPDLLF